MAEGESKKFPQVIATIAATLSAFGFGMSLGWSSPVELKKDDSYNFLVSDRSFSWVGSVVPLGASIACLPTGYLLDMIGRKKTMLLMSIPFTIGWGMIMWPYSVEMLIVGRFITGFCGGASCVASPVYIAEIAETKIRGVLTSFFQLFICFGIELVYIVGAYTSVFYLSMTCTIISACSILCFLFLPEAPQYYLKKDLFENAEKSLKLLRGSDYNIESEINEMKTCIENEKTDISFIDIFKDRVSRKGVLIMIGLMAMEQLTGIHAVIFYTNAIFAATGSTISPELSTIIVGGVEILSIIPVLILIDVVGRRLCLLVSVCGSGVFISILGFYFYFQKELACQGWIPLTTLILYIISFTVGAGTIVWVIGAEIFSPGVKGRGNGIASSFYWGLAFLITKFYSQVSQELGNFTTFCFFGVCCVFGALLVIFIVPETKGKSMEQILSQL